MKSSKLKVPQNIKEKYILNIIKNLNLHYDPSTITGEFLYEIKGLMFPRFYGCLKQNFKPLKNDSLLF